jgi:hypothetical protein
VENLKTEEIIKSPAEYVWFENEQRKEEDNLFGGKILTEKELRNLSGLMTVRMNLKT